jgi:lysophospholipase
MRYLLIVALLFGLCACGPVAEDEIIPTLEAGPEDLGKADSAGPTSPLAKAAWVLQQLKKQGDSFGAFAGKSGVTIAYAVYRVPQEIGAVVLLPGRTEAYVKYFETVYDLRDAGYSIYMMDHRGQGLSGRMLADSQKGHVVEFDDYVDDVQTFIDDVVKAEPHDRLFILSHSMGGAITTRLLERDPKIIDAAVLVSPMHQINTSPYPEFVAEGLAGTLCLVGKCDDYAPGKGPYDPSWAFSKNDVTHCAVRFEMNKRLVQQNPRIALGGPTTRWVRESIDATEDLQDAAARLTTPVLLLQAGSDQVVKIKGQDKVCAAAASCQKVAYPSAYHEILQETDSIRTPALKQIAAFLAQHSL